MDKRKSKKTRIILSAMALIEIIVLVVCVTFSWVEGGNRSKVESGELSVYSGSNLMMLVKGQPTNSITVPACTLEETSSADGRNFYFPLANNTSSATASMKFREGVPADRNTKYISLDFDLQATSATANVYLGAGTIIQCANADVMDALRMSFTFNNNEAPIVFKPSQMPGVNGMFFSPITAISGDGTPTTIGRTDTEAFGDYYYSGEDSNTLFTVEAGETKHITLNIWLEGTTRSFPNAMKDAGLSIYIDFTTSVDDLIKYNIEDNTHAYAVPEDATGADCYTLKAEYWLKNTDEKLDVPYETMMYLYDNDSERYYAFTKSKNNDTDHRWSIYVPNTITNFSFRRYSIDINEWWNEWVPSLSNIPKDMNNEYTYVAICGTSDGKKGNNLTPCGGYWKDEDGTYRVYFQDSHDVRGNEEWATDSVYCYAWDSDNKNVLGGTGKKMTYAGVREDSGAQYNFYYIDLKETDKIVGVIFNKGSWGEHNQTPDITSLFNGAAFYFDGNKTGTWLYTDTSTFDNICKIFS